MRTVCRHSSITTRAILADMINMDPLSMGSKYATIPIVKKYVCQPTWCSTW